MPGRTSLQECWRTAATATLGSRKLCDRVSAGVVPDGTDLLGASHRSGREVDISAIGRSSIDLGLRAKDPSTRPPPASPTTQPSRASANWPSTLDDTSSAPSSTPGQPDHHVSRRDLHGDDLRAAVVRLRRAATGDDHANRAHPDHRAHQQRDAQRQSARCSRPVHCRIPTAAAAARQLNYSPYKLPCPAGCSQGGVQDRPPSLISKPSLLSTPGCEHEFYQ